MALWLDQFRDIRDNTPLKGAFIRNRQHKILVVCTIDGAVFKPCAKRYARDLNMLQAARKLLHQH